MRDLAPGQEGAGGAAAASREGGSGTGVERADRTPFRRGLRRGRSLPASLIGREVAFGGGQVAGVLEEAQGAAALAPGHPADGGVSRGEGHGVGRAGYGPDVRVEGAPGAD